MINIYDSTETKFSHNGICSLDEKRELIKCTIHRKLEGAYEGTLFISKENLKWTEFIEGRILKLPVDINGRTQLFRIFDTSDDFNDLEVYFKHIFFDLDDFFIEDTNIVEKDGRGAINQILNTTIDSHRFTATSDINIINNCRIVDKTVTEAIGVDENCFLNRWGGEIDYDNFKFRINEKIGSDNGYRIALRKNLKAINGDISITEVATKLKIKGYDGIKLDEYLISPLASAYPHFKTRVVKFDDIKVKSDPNDPEEEGYETLQAAQLEMKRRGLELFSKQNIDKPSVNFEIDIDEMREENIEVGVLEVLSIGDIATLKLEDFLRSNIEVKQRVIELEFDCIRKINIKVILGESTSTIFKEVSKIESMLNDLNDKLEGNSWQDILDQSMGQATDIIAEGFKDSHVIPRKNEIIVADNIDLNLAKKVIVINKNGIGFSLDGYRPDRLTLAMTIDGEINASCIKFGSLRGSLIDARNIRVTDGRGNETFNIDSSGNVSLNVTNFKILNKKVYTSEEANSVIDEAVKGVRTNILPNGSFNNGNNGWNKVNVSIPSPVFSYDRYWCNFYASAEEGICYAENVFDILPNRVYNFSMLLAQYNSSKDFYRIRIETQSKGSSSWFTVKEFTGRTTGTREKFEQLSYSFKSDSSAAKCRVWIGKLAGETFDIYVADLFMGTDTIYARKSEFQILDDKISLKVEEGEFGTLLEQNSHAVKIAWNNISDYVQFENGGLSIYNGSVTTSQKRAVFNETGNHFWRDGYYVGKIGTNKFQQDTSIKGLNFNLEQQGGYMSWSVARYAGASNYTMVWTYANKTVGDYAGGKLHAGADIDMHNYILRNVQFEGGGITGTLVFTQIVGMNTDGTAARWYNNSKLVFQNGILIDATWGNG
ncbi:phage tail spike protein [Clostridium perfringens]|nr:phage tail spike protein [Clostridium perfringens]